MSEASDRARFLPIADQAAARYGLPASLVRAVIRQESRWNPEAYRAEPQINDASRGLMQVLLGTARALGYTGSPMGLYDPATSTELGARLLAQNITRASLPGRTHRTAEDIALSAYNAGFSGVRAGDAKRDSAGRIVNQSYVDSVRRFQVAEGGTIAPSSWLFPIAVTLTLAATVAATRPQYRAHR